MVPTEVSSRKKGLKRVGAKAKIKGGSHFCVCARESKMQKKRRAGRKTKASGKNPKESPEKGVLNKPGPTRENPVTTWEA